MTRSAADGCTVAGAPAITPVLVDRRRKTTTRSRRHGHRMIDKGGFVVDARGLELHGERIRQSVRQRVPNHSMMHVSNRGTDIHR
jgi:hypothetical protein